MPVLLILRVKDGLRSPTAAQEQACRSCSCKLSAPEVLNKTQCLFVSGFMQRGGDQVPMKTVVVCL